MIVFLLESSEKLRAQLFLQLDLHIDPGGKVKLHQGIHRLLCGFQNIEKAFMRPDFKLFSRFFIDMGGTEHTVAVDRCGER
jgi:hypothetical protein